MKTPKTECPVCFYAMDHATVLYEEGDPMPRPGDLSVCLRCGALNFFGANLDLHIPDEDELAKISEAQMRDIKRAQAQIVKERFKGGWIP